MQRLLTIITFFIFYAFSSTAQTGWQWGKRGGSSAGGPSSNTEGEVEMVTDQQGNLYVLAKISKGEPGDIDGYISDSANNQLSLSKWGCDGSHKWTKYFGGTGSVSAISSSLAIDSLGGLYFTGSTSTVESAVVPQYVYFDQDIAPYNSRKGWFIMKYDTAGVFQWFRMPQADTVTVGVGPESSGTANKVAAIGLDAAPNGDVYILAYLPHGIFSGTYVNTVPNTFHLMRYSKDGNFLDAKVVDMSVSTTVAEPGIVNLIDPRTGFARDHNSGRFYLSGHYTSDWGSLNFGSTNITKSGSGYPLYLSAFDSNGNHLWVEQTDPALSSSAPYSRPRIDGKGNVYICGGLFDGNTFFGHTFNASFDNLFSFFILSADSAGNLNWAVKAKNELGSQLRGITYNNGIVSVSDLTSGMLIWDTDTIAGAWATVSYNHLARFNANTGRLIKDIDTFRMMGPGSATKDLISDHKNNIYVGGNLSSQAFLPSVTLSNIGGTFDFFVAKYGAADCDCIMPVPDFTYSSASGSTAVNFTYTGTGGTVDSVRWEFGDGAMASGLTTSHTYATAGTYEVSIVMYSNCGMKVIAQKVTTGGGTGIEVPGLSAQLIVYPNPTQQYITIDKAGTNTDIAFYNTIGQKVLQRKAQQENETIDVSALSSGIYIIRIHTPDGKKGSVKFVKE